ncbi:hypothetical protein [Novosphingobium sp. Chol11]|uniref:hypothetical protein n=1 Tax=Novosphingobium sp. Chol11 TaxID=1385763 RepID=UPI0025CCEB1A|nr:hypothetical protein [Novosphingobium sp. Chol11]
MTTVMRIFGVAAVLMGLLWMGQGAGLIMWPASSFMLAQQQWILWGALLALIGLGLVLRSGKRR